MARTNTLSPFLIRKEIVTVGPTVVAPAATPTLATFQAIPIYRPEWVTNNIIIEVNFVGSMTDAGAGSTAQLTLIADSTGIGPGPVARGQSSNFILAAAAVIPLSWKVFNQIPAGGFDATMIPLLQGGNAGAGNVTIGGVATIEYYQPEAP